MRKIIVCLIILLAATLASSGAPPDRLPSLVAPAEARGLMMVGGGVAAVAGCTVDNDGRLSAAITGEAETSIPLYTASNFVVPAGGWTVTRYDVPICKTGSHATTFTVDIRTGDDTDPNDTDPSPIVAGSTVTTANNDITKECSGLATQTFIPTAPFTLAAGTYWLTVSDSGGNTVHVSFGGEGAGGTHRSCETDDGDTWTCYANYRMDFEVWGCAP